MFSKRFMRLIGILIILLALTIIIPHTILAGSDRPADTNMSGLNPLREPGRLPLAQNRTGEVHGMKWRDDDGDGKKDAGEPPLSGWTIIIQESDGFSLTTTTDDRGQYWFKDLEPGSYQVFEAQRQGWAQTFPPPPGIHRFDFDPGQIIDGVDFGNRPRDQKPPGVHGVKWRDDNGNGRQDPGEPPLSGWTIIIEETNNGFSATTTTNDRGRYWFENLQTDVSYQVREAPRSGWVQTQPPTGVYNFTLTPNRPIFGLNFGNQRGDKPTTEVHGLKWRDDNGNGRQDEGEPPLPGWTIVLTGTNGTVMTATTNARGEYWFEKLAVDVRYRVYEVQLPGWLQTHPPPPGDYRFTLAPNQPILHLGFGNQPRDQFEPGSIHGIKWEDQNGNGQRDPGEPPVAGWRILLRGPGFSQATETDEEGRYWFMDLPPGRYRVAEAGRPGWIQTAPPTGVHLVELNQNQMMVEGRNFGNEKEDLIWCRVLWDVHIAPDVTVLVWIIIGNHDNVAHQYDMEFLPGQNVSPFGAVFTPSLPVQVGPGASQTVWAKLDPHPVVMPSPGQFHLLVTDEQDRSVTCSGRLWFDPDFFTRGRGPDGQGVARLPVAGGPQPVGIDLENLIDNDLTLDVKVEVMEGPALDAEAVAAAQGNISLNGQPPGSAVTETIILAANEAMSYTVDVDFINPVDMPADLLFEIDKDNDGNPDSIQSVTIMSEQNPTIYLPIILKGD